MSNEMMIMNTELNFVNKQLSTEVSKISKAISSDKKSKWVVADAIRKIVDEELFKDDFKTEKEFADFLGTSRPNLNKLKNASALKVGVENACLNEYSVGQVIEMLSVDVTLIPKFLIGYQITQNSTIAAIREAVQCYKEDTAIPTNGTLVEDEKEEKSSTSNTATDTEDNTLLEKVISALNKASAEDIEDIYEFMKVRGIIE